MITKQRRVSRDVRHLRLRSRLRGSASRPRLAVFRSLKHIYAQVIDDDTGRTLVAVDSRSQGFGERWKAGARASAETPPTVTSGTTASREAASERREAAPDRGAATSDRGAAASARGTTAGNVAAAKIVGELLAVAARERGIERVVFDRGGYRYHGRVKALADAARAGGLVF
jgi:large subunit ribosomal protein L18